MRFIINFVLFVWCVNLTLSMRDTYRAGVINLPDKAATISSILPLIQEAAKSDVDILLLPSPTADFALESNNYDDVVNSISAAAKETRLYLVAHLLERIRCQNKEETFRSNLVFDREGSIISASRKPESADTTKCNATLSETGTLATDFGVDFTVLMEEDIVILNPANIKNIKNFLVAGTWNSEIPFLNAERFSSSWAFVNNVNLITSAGIYAGKAGKTDASSKPSVVELNKCGGSDNIVTPPVTSVNQQTFPSVDFSQYVVKPLRVEASEDGYAEAVCYGHFCCEFYVKTKRSEPKQRQAEYGLAVFNGRRHFGQNRHIGTQNCAVISAGTFKKTCVGCENTNSSITFEKISITGNFSKEDTEQFPIITSADSNLGSEQFRYHKETSEDSGKIKVTIEITDSSVFDFGILGRKFSKDYEAENSITNVHELDLYNYIFNDDVQEFCAYIWIRLRVLIFIVSIYVLEMM